MDDKRQTESESGEGPDGFAPLSVGFLLFVAPPCLRVCIPVSRRPSLSLFSPSEPIMRELYSWQWQISGTLLHNANNRGYHVRREDGTIFSQSFAICWGYPSFNHPGILDWHCAAQREHQSEDNEEHLHK